MNSTKTHTFYSIKLPEFLGGGGVAWGEGQGESQRLTVSPHWIPSITNLMGSVACFHTAVYGFLVSLIHACSYGVILVTACTHTHSSYMILIRVHKMHHVTIVCW